MLVESIIDSTVDGTVPATVERPQTCLRPSHVSRRISKLDTLVLELDQVTSAVPSARFEAATLDGAAGSVGDVEAVPVVTLTAFE